jgi:hypothetical protein
MARKNSFGKFILSAGEVGSYTVCPESWRLKVIEQRKGSKIHANASREGMKLHALWTKGHEEVIFLTYGARVLIAMVLLLLLWVHSK